MTRQMKTMLAVGAAVATILLGCRSFLANEGDSSSFLTSGRTASNIFEAIQIDPKAEDSAGPQFIAVGDFNNDGMVDITSGWNQSQPIQIHIQQRDADGKIVFATLPVGGTTPIAVMSGLKVADVDSDGFDDIIVLVKDTGLIAHCDQSRADCDVTDNGGIIENAVDGAILIFFNPGDVFTAPWEGIMLSQSQLAGTQEDGLPEEGGYTGIDVGDIDGDGDPDIVVAMNSPEGEPPNVDPPPSTISFFSNPGRGPARNPEGWSRIIINADFPAISACRIADVDGDGDNDVIATFPPAKAANVRWIPNPLSLGADGNVNGLWPAYAPVGQVATQANQIEIGDIDGDGFFDIMVRSTTGKIVQWFKKPASPSQTFIRNPWQVFSIAEFADRAPGAIALGDITGNGMLDAAIAAQGAVAWFTPFTTSENAVLNFWQENLIIDDSPPADSADTSGLLSLVTDPTAAAADSSTFINALIITDIDGDGQADIVATLDRQALSGLSNDALVLFRNTRAD